MNDTQIKSFSIKYLNFYLNTRVEQLGNSPSSPSSSSFLFFFFFKESLPIHSPGETVHVIKSLPCQLIHGFINIQMCYQTGTRSSGRDGAGVCVWRAGAALSLLAVVYDSINYPAVGLLRSSKQRHTSSRPRQIICIHTSHY